jgi:hypothetical protein
VSFEAQSTLIRDRVDWHNMFSSSSMAGAIGQLKKGVEVTMLSSE